MLEVSGLTKRFGGFAAVSGVSFKLEQGEILGLIGPNGSGKSTTFNVIAGLYAPSGGSVRFLGSAEGMSPSRRLLLDAAVRFTRWTSGLPLTDAHNGLRAMSRRGASALCLRQDRMAHASELVDQIRASGLAWTEVPVRIRYTSYSRGKGQRPWAALRILLDYFSGRWLR